jgi:hypothetical protein
VQAMGEAALLLFGFVDRPVNLRELTVSLYTEEIAGFYDSRTKKLFLIDESKPGGEEFDKQGQKLVLAHEMAHALVDQHYDLEALHHAAGTDEDMHLALVSLIEGDAVLMMMAALDGDDVLAKQPEALALYFDLMKRFLPVLSSAAFRKAPRVIRETMTFPYLDGAVFALRTARGSWAAANATFRAPPVSTEQVLHPEKYRVDEPVAFVLPDLAKVAGGGWRSLGSDTLGELQTAVLLGDEPRSLASTGWDGDRYDVLAHSDGRAALAWLTTWDSERDAMEFAGAMAPLLMRRLEKREGQRQKLESEGMLYAVAGAAYGIERRGNDVVVLIEAPETSASGMVEALFGARRAPKRLATGVHGKR